MNTHLIFQRYVLSSRFIPLRNHYNWLLLSFAYNNVLLLSPLCALGRRSFIQLFTIFFVHLFPKNLQPIPPPFAPITIRYWDTPWASCHYRERTPWPIPNASPVLPHDKYTLLYERVSWSFLVWWHLSGNTPRHYCVYIISYPLIVMIGILCIYIFVSHSSSFSGYEHLAFTNTSPPRMQHRPLA